MKPQATTAIILSAGYSSRMGAFKPLLSLGKQTVLERIIGLFREAGILDVRVVVGHRAEDLVPKVEKWGIRWVLNENFQDGMITSVKAGVASIEQNREAFFLLPVDIPLVRRRTLMQQLEAYQACGKGIVYPTFLGKRGHPPLIAARYAEEIVQWNGSGGLRSFLKERESDAVNVAVPDEHIVLDMDTPADYENILQKWAVYDIPSVAECLELLKERCSMTSQLLAHSKKVAQLALTLGQALNERGFSLNLDLIAAAGLLHDMAREQPDHASTAARIIRELDYPAVAAIVEQHMDLTNPSELPVSERDVVCLADKLVLGDLIVSLEERFERRLDCHSDDLNAQAAITARLEHARKLKTYVEQALGTSIEILLSGEPPDSRIGVAENQFVGPRGD